MKIPAYRRVVALEELPDHYWHLTLECGHTVTSRSTSRGSEAPLREWPAPSDPQGSA